MVVTARAQTIDGRDDESTGAVSIQGLKGEALANAIMKSETKAKRRVTLSICGLSGLDESEIDSIPGARPAGYGDDSFPAEGEAKALPALPPPVPGSAPASVPRQAAPVAEAPAAASSPLDARLNAIKAELAAAQGHLQLDACLARLKDASLPKTHPRRGEMNDAYKAAVERIAKMRQPGDEDDGDNSRGEEDGDDPAHDHG